MALELFITRKSRRNLDEAAKRDFEEKLAHHASRARFRVIWDWSQDGRILYVRTTMIRWEVHFGGEEPDHLTLYADVPVYISNFFSQEKQVRFKEEVEKKLNELGF